MTSKIKIDFLTYGQSNISSFNENFSVRSSVIKNTESISLFYMILFSILIIFAAGSFLFFRHMLLDYKNLQYNAKDALQQSEDAVKLSKYNKFYYILLGLIIISVIIIIVLAIILKNSFEYHEITANPNKKETIINVDSPPLSIPSSNIIDQFIKLN